MATTAEGGGVFISCMAVVIDPCIHITPGRWGGGRINLLLALIIGLLATHPFRDGGSTVPAPVKRYLQPLGAQHAFSMYYMRTVCLSHPFFLFRRLWPPSIP